jgi:arylformamidase
MSQFIDLSHTIEDGMTTYKGLPAPVVTAYLTHEDSRIHYDSGHEFHIGRIELLGNTGTYVDSPFHRYRDGDDLSGLSLDALADLDGVVVRHTQSAPAIDVEAFTGLSVKGAAVLVHTGWDRHWRTPEYFEHHPYLTEAAAAHLRDRGARLVGIDSHNIDATTTRSRPVHSLLLAAGIPICEHLCNLGALPDEGFSFFAVPPPIRGLGSFPVRAFALLR